jgi:hypothetical protein
MKQIRRFFYLENRLKNFKKVVSFALILGALVMSAANVAAQAPITPVDTANFHNGVEKYMGGVVPGADNFQFFYVTFAAPAGSQFTNSSYTLTGAPYFNIDNATIGGANSDTLWLTITFRVPSGVNYGDYLDTLTVSAAGASNFVLPLRGTAAQFVVRPFEVTFHKYVAAGDSSDVPEPVTITTEAVDLEDFQFDLVDGTAFRVVKTGQTSDGTYAVVSLSVNFAPPTAGTGPTHFNDTLVVTHPQFRDLIYKIPVSGSAVRITIDPDRLNFGAAVGCTDTEQFSVKVDFPGVSVTEFTSSFPEIFSVEPDPAWDPNSGGIIYVTFSPDTTFTYYGTV